MSEGGRSPTPSISGSAVSLVPRELPLWTGYSGGEAGSGESLVARVSLSIRLNDGHAAHLIKDGRRSHSRRIAILPVRQTTYYSHCPP